MHKIAIISNSAFSVVNFRKKLIEDIVSRGWEVYVLAPDFNRQFRDKLTNCNVVTVDINMSRTGLNPFSDSISFLQLIRHLRSIDPDITFSYGIKPVVYGLTASRLAGIHRRYAMLAGLGTLYVDDQPGILLKNTVLRKTADLMYRISMKSAEKVFFQNPDDRDLFTAKNIIDRNKTVLIDGSGVDTNYYQTEHIQTDPVTFTLVSRLIREKGIYEFVECAGYLRNKYPKKALRFVLLGETDLNPNSVDRQTLEQWVSDGIIEWPGHVEEVKSWLGKTSVFVLPSYYREGTPKSILEAMSMGRPVITTDTPGCRETVNDGKNGFFVVPRDVESVVRACEHFIHDKQLIELMGKESRRIAVSRYDVKKINSKMLSEMNLSVTTNTNGL